MKNTSGYMELYHILSFRKSMLTKALTIPLILICTWTLAGETKTLRGCLSIQPLVCNRHEAGSEPSSTDPFTVMKEMAFTTPKTGLEIGIMMTVSGYRKFKVSTGFRYIFRGFVIQNSDTRVTRQNDFLFSIPVLFGYEVIRVPGYSVSFRAGSSLDFLLFINQLEKNGDYKDTNTLFRKNVDDELWMDVPLIIGCMLSWGPDNAPYCSFEPQVKLMTRILNDQSGHRFRYYTVGIELSFYF